MIKRFSLFLLLAFTYQLALAQTDSSIEMADKLRSNGKIYVVVAVIVTIFAGIILYLVRLDRKISKLEKSRHS